MMSPSRAEARVDSDSTISSENVRLPLGDTSTSTASLVGDIDTSDGGSESSLVVNDHSLLSEKPANAFPLRSSTALSSSSTWYATPPISRGVAMFTRSVGVPAPLTASDVLLIDTTSRVPSGSSVRTTARSPPPSSTGSSKSRRSTGKANTPVSPASGEKPVTLGETVSTERNAHTSADGNDGAGNDDKLKPAKALPIRSSTVPRASSTEYVAPSASSDVARGTVSVLVPLPCRSSSEMTSCTLGAVPSGAHRHTVKESIPTLAFTTTSSVKVMLSSASTATSVALRNGGTASTTRGATSSTAVNRHVTEFCSPAKALPPTSTTAPGEIST